MLLANDDRTLAVKGDSTVGLTAAAGILGALVGTSVLDISGSAKAWRFGDVAVLAAWVLVIVLFAALAARWAPGVGLKRLRLLAWCAAFLAGLATAVMIVATSFGSTRDKDTVLLRMDKRTANALATLCSLRIPQGEIKGEITTTTLNDEFVIVDFKKHEGNRCDTVRIPRTAVIAFQELHKKRKPPQTATRTASPANSIKRPNGPVLNDH